MDMAHFIYLFISQRTSDSLPVLPIVNKDFTNMHVQVFVWTCVGISVTHAPRGRIDESYSLHIFRNFQPAFLSDYTILIDTTNVRRLQFLNVLANTWF